MTGFRSKEFFIEKYGKELGEQRFSKALRTREANIRRRSSNRTIVLGEDLEAEVLNGNAVKCEACGYIGTMLQWTHFKNKCTSGIKSISDYKKLYPNAPLKCERLKKFCAITLESLISAYGEEEGPSRYASYCAKQAETNTLEYKKVKYNMTEAEFKTYNKSRSVTLPNLVARHGEELGLEKWNAYCEQQRYTTSLEYFVEKYGEVDGTKKYYDFVSARNLNWKSTLERECYDNILSQIPDLIFQYKIAGIVSECDMGNSSMVIEFNGTYWHADPRFYAADWEHKHKKYSAQQLWEKDAKKKQRITDAGYRHYIIWEHDYRKDMDKTIEKLLEWANGTEQTGDSRPSGED